MPSPKLRQKISDAVDTDIMTPNDGNSTAKTASERNADLKRKREEEEQNILVSKLQYWNDIDNKKECFKRVELPREYAFTSLGLLHNNNPTIIELFKRFWTDNI